MISKESFKCPSCKRKYPNSDARFVFWFNNKKKIESGKDKGKWSKYKWKRCISCGKETNFQYYGKRVKSKDLL